MDIPVVVLAGGDPVSSSLADRVPDGGFVIAADSGLAHAAVLDVQADLVVGDLDSVDPDELEAARHAGTQVEQHPAAKDRTDLEIALDAAQRHGAREVVVLGGHGGRLDHLLANVLLLASDAHADLRITAHLGAATIHVVRDEATLHGRTGELVSLLPVHGPAHGVRTTGLLYPLHDEDLPAGSTRGVSNECTGGSATVALREGVLVAVLTGELGTHVCAHPDL